MEMGDGDARGGEPMGNFFFLVLLLLSFRSLGFLRIDWSSIDQAHLNLSRNRNGEMSRPVKL